MQYSSQSDNSSQSSSSRLSIMSATASNVSELEATFAKETEKLELLRQEIQIAKGKH